MEQIVEHVQGLCAVCGNIGPVVNNPQAEESAKGKQFLLMAGYTDRQEQPCLKGKGTVPRLIHPVDGLGEANGFREPEEG